MKKFTFEGVENFKNFKDQKAIEFYREENIKAFELMGKFIESFVEKKKINLIEIGSGNSSLLYYLNSINIINKAVGIELAQSRYLFAEKWKLDCGIENVENICGDFRSISIKEENYNIFVCNSTLQYMNQEISNELLDVAYKSLKGNGILIMDIPNYQKLIDKMTNGIFKFKKEFPSSNPFSYGIYEFKNNKNSSDKSYINISNYYDKNNNLKATSKYIVYLWHINKIKELLFKRNFFIENIFGSLNKDQLNIDSDNYYIVARKK